MPVKKLLLCGALFTALLALAACGSSSAPALQASGLARGAQPPASSAEADTDSDTALPLSLPKLPAPSSALGSLRGTSAQQLIVPGSDFEQVLPSQNISTDGSLAVFDPDWAKQETRHFNQTAYAVYRLNLEGFEGAPNLRLLFASAGIERSNLWVGLANWESERWDWQRMPSVVLPQQLDLSGYVGDGGDVLVAVLLLGLQPYKLGLVTVMPTDEVEPNDSTETRQNLASPAVSGFRGDVGGDDPADFFAFPGTTANGYRGYIIFDSAAAAVKVTVYDALGEELSESDSFGSNFLSFIGSFFNPLEENQFPLVVKIEATSGVTAYDLSFGLGSVPDVPDFTYFLMADADYGPLPFTVNFSSTVVDTPEVAYYWDVNDDFRIDAITEEPALTWTYMESGIFEVTMWMRDINGVELGLSVQVAAGDIQYDERENNDNEGQANLLDPLLAGGWLGSIGAAGIFDGDSIDHVALELDPGQAAILTLENIGNQESFVEINGPNMTGLPGDPLQAFNPPIFERKAYDYNIQGGCGDYRLSWVYGYPPDIDLTTDPLPGGGPAPYLLELEALVTDPEGDEIVEIKWDIDDDEVIDYTGSSISHLYETQGDKIIHLYAYDEHGFRSALVYNIYVEPAP